MLKSGDINQFKQLSQFKSLKDFNNQIEQWMLDVKGKFSKGELVALKRLVRYGKDVAGVIYAKIATIVSATHEHDGVGVSRSTFKRMLTKAKEVGLLVIHHTIKKNGKQGHSVYVFNRYASSAKQCENSTLDCENSSIFSQNEPPKGEQLNHHETSNLLKTSNTKNLNKRNITLDSQFTSNKVPKEFTRLVGLFYDSSDTVEELWKVITVSTYHTQYDANTVLNLAMDSFRQLVRLIKKGKVRKSIYAVYWGVVNKQLDQLYFEGLLEDGFAI